MSISTELQSLNNNILGAYTAIQGKDGTVPENKNMENLPAAIESIPSGGGGGIGIPREVDANGVYRFPTQSFSFSLPSNAIDIGDRALSYSFNGCTSLTSVDLSSLVSVNGTYAFYYAFQNCASLTSVNISSLTAVAGASTFYYAFQNCTSLTSVSLSSLATATGNSSFYYAFGSCSGLASISFPALTKIGNNAFNYAFNDCTSLTSVSFPALVTAGAGSFYYAFSGCTSLRTLSFPALAGISDNSIFNSAFRNCTNLRSLSFPALTTSSFGNPTNQFNNMLYGCSGVTVHFPASVQSTIGSWSSVTKGFGGTNTTVLFDL